MNANRLRTPVAPLAGALGGGLTAVLLLASLASIAQAAPHRPAQAENPAALGSLRELPPHAWRNAAGDGLPAPGEAPPEPQQVIDWQDVDLTGATCGRGAPYHYFFSAPAGEPTGLLFLLNGGGACLKEGPAPAGVTGAARQLYCMEFTNFEDIAANKLALGLLSTRVQLVRRNDASNPFRSFVYVFVPYCTGDVHAGAMEQPYDYDPSPNSEFWVLHRGHLNVLAVLNDVKQRFPGVETAVVTGISAGGFGAILNYPEFVARWPRAVLLPDSGIAPPHPSSLMAREGSAMAIRWRARELLPPYCDDTRCLEDTLYLLTAHARAHDGRTAPWLPFGFLQSQRDAVLRAYLEMDECAFETALHWGIAELPDNVRAFVPASDEHVFLLTPNYVTPGGKVDLFRWFTVVATARTVAELPADAIDAWSGCNALRLPWLGRQ